jgi:hypothetical protein
MNAFATIDIAPLAGVALSGLLLALLPLAWVGLRHRGGSAR